MAEAVTKKAAMLSLHSGGANSLVWRRVDNLDKLLEQLPLPEAERPDSKVMIVRSLDTVHVL